MYFVYLLHSEKTGAFYVGSTSTLQERVNGHNHGNTDFTKSGRPWELVYFEGYGSKTMALRRERQLKQHGKGLSVIKQRVGLSIR